MSVLETHQMAVKDSAAYANLARAQHELEVVTSINRLVAWDQETMMPANGTAIRAEQLQYLSGLVHERATDPKFGDLISACESETGLMGDPIIAAGIREARRDFDKATKLPRDLVEEIAKSSSLGMVAWKDARAKNDFSKFLPALQQTVDLNRRKAECYGVADGGELYDALLDIYEPGMTAKRTEEIFGPLREGLVELIGLVEAAPEKPDISVIGQNFDIDAQKAFCADVCKAAGFDFDSGRMDLSTHPFCEGVAFGDTRMTNRYRPDGWAESVFTALHEGGHATYEQGLPKKELSGTALAEAISLGVHESQSRMWENFIGRSKSFWQWGLPLARTMLGDSIPNDVDAIWKAVNVVEPGFIRVESDEVTYNLHIMLRFDLERAMIRGDLACSDLPGAWNERMKNDLGLTVHEDRVGCLQDVHWSMSAIGYFPTYTFGNLFAAQMWAALGKDLPDRDEQFSKGEFGPTLAWFRDKVHQQGRRYGAEELCEMISGSKIDSDFLLRYLTDKVKRVYGM